MNNNGWPPDAPDPHVNSYRLWTIGTNETTAALKFEDRYGKEPEWVIDHAGFLWVGPVPATRDES